MTQYNPGDVVLAYFPFTDLSSQKRRPALVLSSLEYNTRYGDVAILAMTSQEQRSNELFVNHWQNAGLLKPTWLKPLLGTVATSVIERRLGKLAEEDRLCVLKAFDIIVSPEFRH